MSDIDSTLALLAEEITGPRANDSPAGFVRQVVVQSVQSSTVTVREPGSLVDIPEVPYVGAVPKAGVAVMALQYGRTYLVLGGKDNANAGPRGLLGHCRTDRVTGQLVGKYPKSVASGVDAVPLSTIPNDTFLGLVDMPVAENRLIRIGWKFFAAGTADLDNEWYFQVRVSTNNGPVLTLDEARYAPSGLNASSPMGLHLVVTNAGATTWDLDIYASLLSGTGTLHRYSSIAMSSLYVEDLGPA